MKRIKTLIGDLIVILMLIFTLCCCGGSGDTDTEGEYVSDDSYVEETTEETTTTEVQLVEEEMPENEHIFVNKFDNRPSKIIVKNPTDTAYYMKFYDEDGTTVFSFFVRPQSDATMLMGTGTFYLKYACGSVWYGEENLFGKETSFAKDEDNWPFESGKVWTLTMQAQENGNVSTEPIDPEEF